MTGSRPDLQQIPAQPQPARQIIFSQVNKSYENEIVLDRLDLVLPLQGIVCLTGPSGGGKTTLMRLAAGFEKPDGGTIEGHEGLVFSTMFQEDRLLPWLTAAENLDQVLQKQAAAEWLPKVLLTDAAAKYPDELSGGMRRRVALARALAFPSDVLFLDEPFKGLDSALREQMIELVKRERGMRPLFMITHDKFEVEQLADLTFCFSGAPLRLSC